MAALIEAPGAGTVDVGSTGVGCRVFVTLTDGTALTAVVRQHLKRSVKLLNENMFVQIISYRQIMKCQVLAGPMESQENIQLSLRKARLLRCAVENGDLPAVQSLLDNGADANWLGDRKFSSSLAHHEHPALVSAVLASRTDIVELLLKDGPGVMIIEEALSVARRLGRYRSYITYRSPSENPLSDIEKMLELYKVTQNTQREWTLRINQPIKLERKSTMLHKAQALVLAAAQGDASATTSLICEGADPDWVDNVGQSALTHAAKNGHSRVVSQLLAAGCDVSSSDNHGWAAIHYAVLYGRQESVISLADAGEVDRQVLVNGQTPLHVAALCGLPEIARILLAKGAQVDKDDENGDSPLFCSIENGNESMVQVLLEGGSRPNLGRRRNTTALYMAAERGLPSIVRMLLRAGADPSLNIPREAYQHQPRRPLGIAAKNGHSATIWALIEGGARVESWNDASLYYAVAYGQMHCVEALVSCGVLPTNPYRGRRVKSIQLHQRSRPTVSDYARRMGVEANVERAVEQGLRLRGIGLQYWMLKHHEQAIGTLHCWVANVLMCGRRHARAPPALCGTVPLLPLEMWFEVFSFLRVWEMCKTETARVPTVLRGKARKSAARITRLYD